jgi:hypothetical protein
LIDELKKTIDKSSKVHKQNNSKKSIFSKLKNLLIICRNRSKTNKVKEILSLLISCIEDNKIISPLLHALSSISFVDAEASESPRTISSLEEERGNQEVIDEIKTLLIYDVKCWQTLLNKTFDTLFQTPTKESKEKSDESPKDKIPITNEDPAVKAINKNETLVNDLLQEIDKCNITDIYSVREMCKKSRKFTTKEFDIKWKH